MAGPYSHNAGLKLSDDIYSMAANISGSSTSEMLIGCVHTATLSVCTVLVIFVLFLGCTGNGMTLFSALTTRRLRSNAELFVINLAGADFIMCACLAPTLLFLLFSDSAVPIVFCGSLLFLGTTSCLLSLLSLVAIALHRQLRVSGRIRRPLNLTQASTTVAFIWIISIASAFGGVAHSLATWGRGSLNKCQMLVGDHERLGNNCFVLHFMAPIAAISLGTIAVCYGFIARNSRKLYRYDNAAAHANNQHNLDELTIEHCENGHQQGAGLVSNTSLGGEHLDDNRRKAGTTCFVVTLIVVLCWTSLIMSEVIEIVTGPSIILLQVKICGTFLVFLNSALNPYIYDQPNSSIKERYTRLLCSSACCDTTAQRTNKLRKTEVRTFGSRLLRYSHMTSDTSSAHACAHGSSEKGSEICDMSFVNNCNNTYSQNILLVHGYAHKEPRQQNEDNFSVQLR